VKIRLLIFLFSVAFVAFVLWGGQILINQLSGKQKEIQKEILRREDALMKKIQVKILETGYQPIRSGVQEIYSPVLVVEVTNISQEALAETRLVSYLKKNGGVICSDVCKLDLLQSGATKTATLKCSQSTGTKSSPQRLEFTQKEESITFELWLEAVDISMVVANGKIESEVISVWERGVSWRILGGANRKQSRNHLQL